MIGNTICVADIKARSQSLAMAAGKEPSLAFLVIL